MLCTPPNKQTNKQQREKLSLKKKRFRISSLLLRYNVYMKEDKGISQCYLLFNFSSTSHLSSSPDIRKKD
eukprot:gene5774-4125_t